MKKNIKSILIIVVAVVVCGLTADMFNRLNGKAWTEKKNITGANIQNHENTGSGKFSLSGLIPKDTVGLVFYNHKYFVLGYSNDNRQAGWVAWLLTKDMVENKSVRRSNNFRKDESLECCASLPEDYNRSGYDKGHLCPSGDMTWSKDANQETFLMSNISPQNRKLNRGLWNDLENYERSFALNNDSVLIITGPIFNNPLGRIGRNRVTVPSAYFKIIIDISYPTYKAVAFIMHNGNLKQKIWTYRVGIKDIEKQTGLNFFPAFDEDEQIRQLEIAIDDV
jgi:endonuclease G